MEKKNKFSLAKLINKNKKLSLAIIILLVILIAVIIIVSVSGEKKPDISKIEYSRISQADVAVRSNSISMVAWGGYSNDVPPNTLAAIEKAHAEDYFDVYFDVQLTKDGMWVLFSEEELDDTTNLEGTVSEHTYYEILEGSIDFEYVSEFVRKYKIPTLEEAIELCSSHDLKPYINVMTYDAEKLEDIIILLEKYEIQDKSAIVSSDTKTLLDVQKLSDTQECWFKMEKITEENIGIIKANPSVGALFDINISANDEEDITSLCKTGAKVGCYEVNTLEEFEEYYSYGVTTFITQRILLK